MEGIIKAIGKSEYDTAGMLILLDNLKQDDLEKLLYFFVYKLIDKKMTESMFIEMVNYIGRTKIDFNILKHIKQIIELLLDNNYNNGSELVVVLCDIKNVSRELSKFINYLFETDGEINKKILICLYDDNPETETKPEIYNFENIIKSYNIINEIERYIKAFNKLAVNAHPSSLNENENNEESEEELQILCKKRKSKYTVKYITDQFEAHCKDEIFNRLVLLRKYFGIYLMSIIGIEIITTHDYHSMKYTDIVHYYFESIKKIKRYINNHIKLYKNYIRLYEHYNDLVNEDIVTTDSNINDEHDFVFIQNYNNLNEKDNNDYNISIVNESLNKESNEEIEKII